MERDVEWEVGQSVVVQWYPLRNNGDSSLYPTTITKVGRKYIEVEGERGRFHVSDGSHDGGSYMSRGRLWPDEQTYRQDVIVSKWRATVRRHLSDYSFRPTDEQLDGIAAVMGWEQLP